MNRIKQRSADVSHTHHWKTSEALEADPLSHWSESSNDFKKPRAKAFSVFYLLLRLPCTKSSGKRYRPSVVTARSERTDRSYSRDLTAPSCMSCYIICVSLSHRNHILMMTLKFHLWVDRPCKKVSFKVRPLWHRVLSHRDRQQSEASEWSLDSH